MKNNKLFSKILLISFGFLMFLSAEYVAHAVSLDGNNVTMSVGESYSSTTWWNSSDSACKSHNEGVARTSVNKSGIWVWNVSQCTITAISSGTTDVDFFNSDGSKDHTLHVTVTGSSNNSSTENANGSSETDACYKCFDDRYLWGNYSTNPNCIKTGLGDAQQCADSNSTSGNGNASDAGSNGGGGVPVASMTFPEQETDDLNNIPAVPSSYTSDGVCSEYTVKRLDRPYKFTLGGGTLGHVNYSAQSFCVDSLDAEYPSMCLDPTIIGPTAKGTLYNSDGLIDVNSKFGRAVYYIYTHYYNHDNAMTAEINQAVRILEEYWDDDEYQFLGKTDGIYRKDALPYINYTLGSGVSCSGAGCAAGDIEPMLNAAIAYGEDESQGMPHTVDVSLTKTNEATDGGNFNVEAQLAISGLSGSANISDSDITFIYTNEAGEEIADTFDEQISLVSSDENTKLYNLYISGSTDQCQLNVQAKIKYYDPEDVKNIVILRSKTQTEMQRFLVFLDGNIVTGDSMGIGFGACENTCVTVEGFDCIDSASIAYVIEGKDQDSPNVDWDACIIDKTDPKGNSYTVQEKVEASVNGKTSTYCTVSCKEDFAFKMPGDLGEVKQGRYISINLDGQYHAVAGIAAQRTCLSSAIANTTYETDAALLKKQMLEYLNAYSYYKAMYESLNSAEAKEAYGNGVRTQGQTWKAAESVEPSSEGPGSAPYGGNIDQYFGYYEEFKGYTHPSIKYNVYKFDNSSSDKNVITANVVVSKANQSITTGTAFTRTLGTVGPNPTGTVPEYSNTISDNEGPYDYTYENQNDCRWDTDIYGNREKHCSQATGHTTYKIKSLADGDDKMTKYKEIVEQVKNAYEDAIANYNSTRSTLEDITQKINICTTWNLDYTFDPDITFSYDETSYMEMIGANNKLVAMNEVSKTEEKHFCTNVQESVEGVLGCPSDRSAGLREANIPKELSEDITTAPESDPINYYSFARIAMIDRYGNPGVDIMGNKSGAQEFKYFRSNSVFYSYPKNGIATLNKDHGNTTILDIDDPNRGSNEPDGYVYPVSISTPVGVYNYRLTYKNIGQYFNSNRGLGRIMGDDGYLLGVKQNEYVCIYNVCAFDDPDCGDDCVGPDCDPDPKNTCVDILNSKVCNYGGFNNNSELTEIEKAQYQLCAEALLNSSEDCCKYVNESFIGVGISDRYNEVCKLPNTCTGFKIIDGVTNLSDSANVNDDGRLQFTVKSVSLDNLFPNNNAGVNWTTSQGTSATSEIQSKGESVYANAQYSYVLTPACMAVIREYNAQAESVGLGFGDYTLVSSDNGKKDNSTFLNIMEQNGCIVNARNEGGN